MRLIIRPEIRCHRAAAAKGAIRRPILVEADEREILSRPGGVVAACVWDHAGRQSPVALFWDAARVLDPGCDDESSLAGAREGHLRELFEAAGLSEIEDTALPVQVEHPSFEEWWERFTLGVGPAGAFVAQLDADRLGELEELCRARLPSAPFTITARAWAARGLA